MSDIVLENFTDHKRQKIKESMKALGAPSTKPKIDSSNRTLVRSWLNGLGFPTRTYENATLEQLRAAYHSFTAEGKALGLAPFLQAAGCVNHYHLNMIHILERSSVPLQDLEFEGVLMPEVEAMQKYLTNQPTKKEEPTMPKTATADGKQTQWEFGVKTPPQWSTDVTPTPIPAGVNPEAMKAVAALMAAIAAPQAAPMDESRIIELIQKHSTATKITIERDGQERTIPTGLHHKALPDVIKMLDAGMNVMMVGPAGSGKTTIADQAAKALDIPFYFNGALSSEYKLSGFVDAQGRITSTAFRRAYETGGLYLFDEIDASMPDALLAFNAALSNGHSDFPDGSINRHENFRCMAAANTFGRGADRVYVGRNQLDGASLDRFSVINIEYDEKMERALTANDNWTDFVLKIRSAVFDLKIRHVVSPRASINGAKLLSAGMDRRFVEEATIWKGLERDTVSKITAKAGI